MVKTSLRSEREHDHYWMHCLYKADDISHLAIECDLKGQQYVTWDSPSDVLTSPST